MYSYSACEFKLFNDDQCMIWFLNSCIVIFTSRKQFIKDMSEYYMNNVTLPQPGSYCRSHCCRIKYLRLTVNVMLHGWSLGIQFCKYYLCKSFLQKSSVSVAFVIQIDRRSCLFEIRQLRVLFTLVVIFVVQLL